MMWVPPSYSYPCKVREVSLYFHKYFINNSNRHNPFLRNLHGMTSYSQIGVFHWNPYYLDWISGLDLFATILCDVGQNRFHDFNTLLKTKRRRCGVEKSAYVLFLFPFSCTNYKRRSSDACLIGKLLSLRVNCFSETCDNVSYPAWIASKFLWQIEKMLRVTSTAIHSVIT